MKILTRGLILGCLIMSGSLLSGCGTKEIHQVPVIVEKKDPTILRAQTPIPQPPLFESATNLDLLNWGLDLQSRLDECNKSKQ